TDEGLNQQSFGFFVMDAARPQIKFEARVERTGSGAVAADYVVGEDFQLRLVVGFGLVGEQKRARHHLGIGLLRVLLNDNFALKHAVTPVVQDCLELLTAFAVAGGVFDQQRGVDVVLAAQQVDATNPRLGAFAGKTDEALVTHQLRVSGKSESIELRARADRGQQARQMQRVCTGDLEIVDLRFIAGHQFERRIDLGVAALVALYDGRPGALLHHDQRAHEHRARFVAAGGKHKMDRPLRRSASGNADYDAVAHQRCVERYGNVVRLKDLADMG